MHTLKDFFEDIEFEIKDVLDDCNLDFEVDKSRFNSVDGEEGDYGVISYSSPDVGVVCRKVIEGGDYEYYLYSSEGKKFLMQKVLNALQEMLK